MPLHDIVRVMRAEFVSIVFVFVALSRRVDAEDATNTSGSDTKLHYPHGIVLLIFSACTLYWVIYGAKEISKAMECTIVESVYASDAKEDEKKKKKRKKKGNEPKLRARKQSIVDRYVFHGNQRTPSHKMKDKRLRRSSLFDGFHAFEAWSPEDELNERIGSDARALLRGSYMVSDDQETAIAITEEGLGSDRLIGWLTLYWDIPSTIIQPFMIFHVWPNALRVPFVYAGSVFYVGGDLAFRQLKTAFLWVSLFLVLGVEFFREARQKRKRGNAFLNFLTLETIERVRYVGSKVVYGALYTMMIFQAASKLNYISCDEGISGFTEGACTILRTDAAQNSTNVTFEESHIVVNDDWDIPTVVLALAIFVLAFRGALKYTLLEKNSYSSFVWFPAYDAQRYTLKTIICAVGGIFKYNPWIAIPVFFLGFVVLLRFTYWYQPCQGRGRVANNLRALGFSLGIWFSFCALVCLIFSVGESEWSDVQVVYAYCILVMGGLGIAFAAWKVNDRRARQFSLPDVAWEDMLDSSLHSPYVAKVAADASLLLCMHKGGSIADTLLEVAIAKQLKIHLMSPNASTFLLWRLCACYILCGSSISETRSISRTRSSEGAQKRRSVASVVFTKRKKKKTWTMKMLPCFKAGKNKVSVFVNARPTRGSSKVTKSGRRIGEEEIKSMYDQNEFNIACRKLLEISRMGDGDGEALNVVRRKVAGVLVIVSGQIDTNSIVKLPDSVNAPKGMHAMLNAHMRFISSPSSTPETLLASMTWIHKFSKRLADVYTHGRKEKDPFADYFFTRNPIDSEITANASIVVPILSHLRVSHAVHRKHLQPTVRNQRNTKTKYRATFTEKRRITHNTVNRILALQVLTTKHLWVLEADLTKQSAEMGFVEFPPHWELTLHYLSLLSFSLYPQTSRAARQLFHRIKNDCKGLKFRNETKMHPLLKLIENLDFKLFVLAKSIQSINDEYVRVREAHSRSQGNTKKKRGTMFFRPSGQTLGGTKMSWSTIDPSLGKVLTAIANDSVKLGPNRGSSRHHTGLQTMTKMDDILENQHARNVMVEEAHTDMQLMFANVLLNEACFARLLSIWNSKYIGVGNRMLRKTLSSATFASSSKSLKKIKTPKVLPPPPTSSELYALPDWMSSAVHDIPELDKLAEMDTFWNAIGCF